MGPELPLGVHLSLPEPGNRSPKVYFRMSAEPSESFSLGPFYGITWGKKRKAEK